MSQVILSYRHNHKEKKAVALDDILFVRAEHYQGFNGEFLRVCTGIREGIYLGGIALKKDNQKLFKQSILPDPHLVKMEAGRRWVKFPLAR